VEVPVLTEILVEHQDPGVLYVGQVNGVIHVP